ncbi:tetratricopeptide repeat protein [Saccharothrix deserti]|uniref:tetratricopeptide repeat protein n=1 Tax=Saccharothrix deserti TaxID=2593674 RepID=UPI001EE428F8|nr:tetratricopeptide repeat protein [Saccharothrix deserti]
MRTAEALSHHRNALALAREISEPLQEAKSLDGVAHCLDEMGEHHDASTTWRQAMALFTTLHHPEAARIADRLRLREPTTANGQPLPRPS